MGSEILFLQQILGAVSGLGHAALLTGLFIVVVFRPERIRSRTLFYLACWSLALSILLPSLFSLLLGAAGAGFLAGPRGYPPPSGLSLGFILAIGCGPVLYGLSVLLALLALVPGPRTQSPFQPPKHPLE